MSFAVVELVSLRRFFFHRGKAKNKQRAARVLYLSKRLLQKTDYIVSKLLARFPKLTHIFESLTFSFWYPTPYKYSSHYADNAI